MSPEKSNKEQLRSHQFQLFFDAIENLQLYSSKINYELLYLEMIRSKQSRNPRFNYQFAINKNHLSKGLRDLLYYKEDLRICISELLIEINLCTHLEEFDLIIDKAIRLAEEE